MVPPSEVDPKELEKKLNLICFFTEVQKHFPDSQSKHVMNTLGTTRQFS